MEKFFKLLAATLLVAALGLGCAMAASYVKWETPHYAQLDQNEFEESHPISGMHFDVENVVETFEYDDAYGIIYHDPDANMFACEILVDLQTYKMIEAYFNHSKSCMGTLESVGTVSDSDNVEVFSFVPYPAWEGEE